MRAFLSPTDASRTDWLVDSREFVGEDHAAQAEALRIQAEVEPPDAWVHVYHGPALLRCSATEVSVNGLTPAGFIIDARDALAEALATFCQE